MRRDFAGYGRLFAKDGEWIGGFGRLRGPAEITKVVGERMTPAPGKPPIKGVHVFSNIDIALDGDRATAVTKWQFITPGPDGKPVSMIVGHYCRQARSRERRLEIQGAHRLRRRAVPRSAGAGRSGRAPETRRLGTHA